jgi:Na+/phosphate symporter
VFSIFKESGSTLKGVEQRLDEMLTDCNRMYSLATRAIFGEAESAAVSEELWSLDKGVNRAERAIRRDLLVHVSVTGANMEQGLVLAYMTVAKDIERIGDYCKNIWDLTAHGVDLSGHDDSGMLRSHADQVAAFLEEGTRVFAAQDEQGAHSLIPRLEMAAAAHDELVFGYVESDEAGSILVPRALYFRFLKRIAGHMENILSALVMPLDRIDYYKPSKAAK